MVDCVVMSNLCSEQLSCNQDVHIVHKCFHCVDSERQLKETLMELSSLQLIKVKDFVCDFGVNSP